MAFTLIATQKEYGQLKGKISYLANEPGKEGFFTTKVTLERSQLTRPIVLREWMIGEANIITQDISFFNRITSSIFRKIP